jgi:molecular chaperone DnaJ
MVSTSTCPSCNGSGKIIKNKPAGSDPNGMLTSEEIIPIKIPGGITDVMQLSMGGKGNEPPFGGVPGDLLILVEEIPHKILTRDGNNLVYDLYISFVEAALGTSVEIPTLSNKVKIKIEPGTQPGKILRLRGKGVKDINGYGQGDQLIHVNVWTPKQLTPEEKTILENLRDSENFKPNPGKQERGFFERMKEFFH